MKKNLRLFVLIACFHFYQISSAQTLSFSLTPLSQCYNAANTGTAFVGTAPPTATYYAWTANGSACNGSIWASSSNSNIVSFNYPCAGVYTVVCTAYNSSSVVVATTSMIATVYALPTLTVSGTGTICAGNGATLCASGASSYTWVPGSIVGACAMVSPSVNTCYTVTGNNGNCSSQTVACVNVSPLPNITIAASNTAICVGNWVILTASGANTYTWSNASTASSIVVTPTASTLYSVIGMNSLGCTYSANQVVIVNPTPTVMAISTQTNVCFGNSVYLTGPSSYTLYPPGAPFPLTLTPAASTCYTLVNSSGSGPNTCTNSSSFCINVLPLPTVAIAGNNTVCAGSSTTLTASGAITYSWSNSSLGSTQTVIPTASTCYSVMGTDANGCDGYSSLCVTVDTTCAMVWPGDANSDGVVNSSDVLEIGLAYNATGTARSPGGNSFTSQFANAWAGTVSTGKNQCHADCDGSGTIDNGDTLAIYNNFSLTHPFRPSPSSSAGMQIVLPGNIAFMGQWNVADIVCTDQLNQVFGMVFDVNFDQSLIETNSAYIVYTSSFLNASNQNVQFRKTVFANGKVYAASVRTDAANVNGTGKIGELYFKVKDGLPANTTLNMSVSNAFKIDKNASQLAITSAAATAVTVVENPVSVKEKSRLEHAIQVFPNPASKQLNLYNSAGTNITYTLYDILGKEVMKGELSSSKTLDISSCGSGCYMMKFETGENSVYKKIIVEN
jgi:hypothetical protein